MSNNRYKVVTKRTVYETTIVEAPLATEARELVLPEEKETDDLSFYSVENLSVSDKETDVHTEHCCLSCGCKYSNKDCTVMIEQRKQSYPHSDNCYW